MRLTDRPTGDLLVLLLAGTICFSVVASGATLGILRIVRPEQDIGSGVNILSDTINTLIGLMAGFLAGRTDAKREADAGSGDR